MSSTVNIDSGATDNWIPPTFHQVHNIQRDLRPIHVNTAGADILESSHTGILPLPLNMNASTCKILPGLIGDEGLLSVGKITHNH